MSENPPQSAWGLVTGCVLIALISVAIASLAIHPPQMPRQAREECQVSGRVTVHDRPVLRGTICFSCVMVDSSLNVESFPDVTVRIVDGSYVLSGADGLLPGRYEVTIRAQEVGTSAIDSEAEGPPAHRIRYPTPTLVAVASGSPSRVDFEL